MTLLGAIPDIPQVSGLAKRVHDSAPISEEFDRIIKRDAGEGRLITDKTALDRRVVTRWNSDLACISAHVLFEAQVKQLIAVIPALEEHLMTGPQWDLAKEMEEVLAVRIYHPISTSTMLILR